MRLPRTQSILFQVTALFLFTSLVAMVAVFSQSTILRTQTLQTLSEEIRQGEVTLFQKTAQVARERMTHYAYSADPGESSVWQLRGRRSPVAAIKSENQRRIEIVVGPIFTRLNDQQTINTLVILSPDGDPLYAFDDQAKIDENATAGRTSAGAATNPKLRLGEAILEKNLVSGFARYEDRLQHFVVFPIFSNAKVLAYIYYGIDFNTLKTAFEIESSSTVWRITAGVEISNPLLLDVIDAVTANEAESSIFAQADSAHVLGKYSLPVSQPQTESILFIKDISNTFNRGKEFQTTMLIGLVVLLLLFAYFVYSMLRRRLRPLGSAIEVLNDLSNGDLNSRVVHKRNDEIGRIGKAIDVFRDKLIDFNAMNNEARRQRMMQQEEVLQQTSALVELLPPERRDDIQSKIQEIDLEISTSLKNQTDQTLTVGDNSVSKLFAASFSLLSDELSEQYRVLDDKVRRRTIELERKSEEIALALSQNEELLLNILPKPIAERMKDDERTIADEFADSSILFADIVGFTSLAERMGPAGLVTMLNRLFSQFDNFSDELGLEKIKTIGDSYMVAGGVPLPFSDHCEKIARMALLMQEFVNDQPLFDGKRIMLRVGLHAGPVIAGVIGKRKFVYDLWGDAVNVAARMESHGLPGKIHVSHAMKERLQNDFVLDYRDTIEVKGKGPMATYWLDGLAKGRSKRS